VVLRHHMGRDQIRFVFWGNAEPRLIVLDRLCQGFLDLHKLGSAIDF